MYFVPFQEQCKDKAGWTLNSIQMWVTEWTQILVKNTKPREFKQAVKSDWKHTSAEERTQEKYFIPICPSVAKPGEPVVWAEAIFLISSNSLETYLNGVPP